MDLKDVNLGVQPKVVAGSIKDNLAPTNTINAAISPRLWTIFASGCDASESAVFKLTGPINFNSIDNNPPYALFANVGSTYFAQNHPNYGSSGSTFPNGTYNLVIDLRSSDGVGGPFPKNRIAVGSLLATRSLQFTVASPINGREAAVEASLPSTQEWVSIFQNPVNEEIVLYLSGQIGEEVSFSLMNLQGQTIQSQSIKLTSSQQYEVLDVRTQNAGMYILKAIKAEKIKTIKVIKSE
ncbi:MAG: T9SS type A sorting domain-containing protein [Spirosomataceae bacterium]